jgi:hypothetical protein
MQATTVEPDTSGCLSWAQATIWVWCFWHAGPPLGIFFYVVSERIDPGHLARGSNRADILFALALVLALLASIAAVTLFHDLLPVLDVGGNYHRITTFGIAPAIQVLIALALLLMWSTTGFRTVLQLWLGVALLALLCDNAITMLGGRVSRLAGISAG